MYRKLHFKPINGDFGQLLNGKRVITADISKFAAETLIKMSKVAIAKERRFKNKLKRQGELR